MDTISSKLFTAILESTLLTRLNWASTDQNVKKYAQHHIQGHNYQHLGIREDTSHIYIIFKLSGPGPGTSTASKTIDGPRVSPLLTRFNKIAIQGAHQMAVDKEATILAFRESTHIILSVTFPYSMCNLP